MQKWRSWQKHRAYRRKAWTPPPNLFATSSVTWRDCRLKKSSTKTGLPNKNCSTQVKREPDCVRCATSKKGLSLYRVFTEHAWRALRRNWNPRKRLVEAAVITSFKSSCCQKSFKTRTPSFIYFKFASFNFLCKRWIRNKNHSILLVYY